MRLSSRSFSSEVVRRSGLGAATALLLAVPGLADQATQAAPRLVYMSCAYAQGTAFYLTGNFSVPATQVGAAKMAFRQFAQNQSGNQATSQACRVAATESSLQAARQSDRSAVSSQSNQQARIVDIGWRFTPTESATAAPLAATPASRYRQTGLPNTQTPAAQSTNAQTTSSSHQQAGRSDQPSGATGSSPVSGVAPAGQSMKDNAMNTGANITSSATQAATDATTQLQKAAAEKFSSLFHRQPKPNTNQAQQPASAPAPATAATTLLAENKQPASVAAALPVTSATSGPTFATCHAAAVPTEYLSEVFPVFESDDTRLRYAFWQVVARQHKAGPVPYSAVSCVRAASEQEATGLRTAALEAATKRGVTASQVVNTGWSYLGQ